MKSIRKIVLVLAASTVVLGIASTAAPAQAFDTGWGYSVHPMR